MEERPRRRGDPEQGGVRAEFGMRRMGSGVWFSCTATGSIMLFTKASSNTWITGGSKELQTNEGREEGGRRVWCFLKLLSRHLCSSQRHLDADA